MSCMIRFVASRGVLYLASTVLLLTSGAGAPDRSPAPAAPISEQTVQSRADALLQQMTPEDKAAQLTQYFYFQLFPPLTAKLTEAVEKGQVGSLLFVTDPVEINRLQKLAVE